MHGDIKDSRETFPTESSVTHIMLSKVWVFMGFWGSEDMASRTSYVNLGKTLNFCVVYFLHL